jgi:protein SCO1/2
MTLFSGIVLTSFYFILQPKITLPIYSPNMVSSELVEEEIQYVKKYHKISDFSLTNQNGETITQDYYENKIYIADFFFTTCPTICPIMTKNMFEVQQKTLKQNVLLVSYSVTPEIDSIAQLKKYALENKVNDNKWNLLTGDKKQIYELARKSYLVAKNDGDGGKYDMIHTENFVLIDKEKRIRGYYDGTNKEDIDKLLSDVKILENLYKNSKNEKNNI